MSYDNIKFVKPNMEFVDGYFYTMDDTKDVLFQKVDDGSTAFVYPLQALLSSTVNSLQYDGANFWSLQDSGDGFVVKRWRIENHVVELKDSFIYTDTAEINYDADTFAVENYRTVFTSTISGGNIVITPNEYYDNVISSGIVLTLGPNKYEEREEVTVSGVSGSDVTLVSGTQYSYESGDPISMYRNFFVFNNYDGLDGSNGSLMRFDAYTGTLIASDVRSEYKDITACTFARITNLLRDYNDVHTVIFTKGTQARFRNMSDLTDLLQADSVNEYFTGPDDSLPNTTRWSITYGDPVIYGNRLQCTTTIDGHDEIESNYEIIGDFSVQISGSLDGGFAVISSGVAYFEHYMDVNIDSNRYTIGSTYSNAQPVLQLFIGDNGGYDSYTTFSGIDYKFKVVRADTDLSYYYQTVVSGLWSGWQFFNNYVVTTRNCSLSLGLVSAGLTVSGAYFDDLEYQYGTVRYPPPTTPYYDIMVMDNIRINESTIIPITDIAYSTGNLYRLQDEGTYYGTDNDWGSQYNYVCSPVRSFIDAITIEAIPIILPANGRNVATINCVVLDQFANGAMDVPIFFTDNDDYGYVTINPQYTDYIYGTGAAITYYRAGVDIHTVTVQGTVTQYD